MIKFKKKKFNLSDGHYTGPKDYDKVPGAVEIVGKSALGGAIAGGIIGGVVKDSTVWNGAKIGGGAGLVGGIALKVFLNYLHKPMNRITYQTVDKTIRREFGIYRMAGITVGDSIDKRSSIDEKFGFNDRNVTDYKLNFSIQDDRITMYTLGLSNGEIDKLDNILNYYCKKYTGMNYESMLLNDRLNSYSVVIAFTNYQVVSNFIMELSNTLETKINLLDSKALVDGRIRSSFDEEKSFSIKSINKFDVIDILSKTGTHVLRGLNFGWKDSVANGVLGAIVETSDKLNDKDLIRAGVPMPRESFDNKYLDDTLKKLRYLEGHHYTVGEKNAESNFSMVSGLFVLTTTKNTKDSKEIDKIWEHLKTKINRSDTGKALVYTYSIQSRQEFEFILKKLMSTGIKFNIYEK